MFKSAFSGFSVDDLDKAEKFYAETLKLDVEHTMGVTLHLPGGGSVFVYPKKDHRPASYTVLNLVVENIDEAVATLKARGVEFLRYPDMPQDDNGIARGIMHANGPDIAWFADPAGNIIAVLQQKSAE